jgi:hypothetical protein
MVCRRRMGRFVGLVCLPDVLRPRRPFEIPKRLQVIRVRTGHRICSPAELVAKRKLLQGSRCQSLWLACLGVFHRPAQPYGFIWDS